MNKKFEQNKNTIRPEDKTVMNGKVGSGLGLEGPSKNPLSERIKDISLLIIPKGSVLLKMIEKENVMGDILLPDIVDKSQFGGMYYEVFMTGNDQFAKTHKEFKDEGITQVGNIVISLKPLMSKEYTNNGQVYIQVHESLIECQVHPDNFNKF